MKVVLPIRYRATIRSDANASFDSGPPGLIPSAYREAWGNQQIPKTRFGVCRF